MDMQTPDSSRDTGWIKAAASAQGGNCVQMRRRGNRIEVRDRKDPNGAVLSFTGPEFAAWLDGAKGSEFDGLLG